MGDDVDIDSNVDRSTFDADLNRDLMAGQPLTWPYLRELMRFSLRNEQGKQLGLWSLEVLEHALGEHWLSVTRERDSDLDMILFWATYRNEFLLEIVEFALALTTLERVEGFAKACKDLRRNATFERFWHTRALFQLGRQSLMLGHNIAFERKLSKSTSPIDISIVSQSGIELLGEVFCISRSDHVIQDNKRVDQIRECMGRLAIDRQVIIDAAWKALPDETKVRDHLLDIKDNAEIVGTTGMPRSLTFDSVDIHISPAQDRAGGLGNYSGPVIVGDGLDRILDKIRNKITQTHSSSANWIFAEVNDDLWQLTSWAMEPLSIKLEMIRSWILELLRESSWCHGIVLTSGVTTAMMTRALEDIRSPYCGYALRRSFEPSNLRTRETIIVPVNPKADEEARSWLELLAAEPDWLPYTLQQRGMATLDQVLAFAGQ